MSKIKSQCTSKETVNYLTEYFATVDVLTEAMETYKSLAEDADTAGERSAFRAEALKAQGELELLKSKRIAFMSEQTPIDPPSDQAVAEAQQRAHRLANVIAADAKFDAVLRIANEALQAFETVQA
jgi:hypothetical protein